MVQGLRQLPAADDGLAGEGQVQEVLARPEREGVLQGGAVDDEGEVVLLVQGVAQHPTVVAQGLPGPLRTRDTQENTLNIRLILSFINTMIMFIIHRSQ